MIWVSFLGFQSISTVDGQGRHIAYKRVYISLGIYNYNIIFVLSHYVRIYPAQQYILISISFRVFLMTSLCYDMSVSNSDSNNNNQCYSIISIPPTPTDSTIDIHRVRNETILHSFLLALLSSSGFTGVSCLWHCTSR